MPVRPFTSDAEVVRFAEEFLDEHRKRFEKDIAICLKANDENSHAYFPALITCIAFLDFLSGLYAGTLETHSLKELKDYVRNFMDPSEYTEDRLNVLYELFRHKVAHLALPYAVFDTSTKPKTFGQRRRLGRVLINRDCSPIAGCRKRRVRIAPEVQAIFCRRRHQPRRPPLQLAIAVAQSKAC